MEDAPAELEADDPRRYKSTHWGCLIALMPVVLAILLAIAYTVLIGAGLLGRTASGDAVEMGFDTCPAGVAVLTQRVEEMGLYDAVWVEDEQGATVTLTLPADARIAAEIPSTLVRPGRLEVRGGGEVLLTEQEIESAAVRVDLFMTPSVLIRVPEAVGDRLVDHVTAQPAGTMGFFIDGASVGIQANRQPVERNTLEMTPEGAADDQAAMEAAAADAIVLSSGPLDCPTSLRDEPRQPSGDHATP